MRRLRTLQLVERIRSLKIDKQIYFEDIEEEGIYY